jgi:hypothetical protein
MANSEDPVSITSDEEMTDEMKQELAEFQKSMSSSFNDFMKYNKLYNNIHDRLRDILDNQPECSKISRVVKNLVEKSVLKLNLSMKDTDPSKLSYESYLESLVELLKIYTAVYKVAYSLKIHMIDTYQVKRQLVEHVDLEAQYDTEKNAEYNTKKFEKLLKDVNFNININTNVLNPNTKEERKDSSYVG